MTKDWKASVWSGKPLPQAPHLRRGRWAEVKAREFLERRGLRLIDRNYHSRHGELDLIMLDPAGVLVFIEVRFRADSRFGDGGESIDRRKQQRIKNCAEHFLTQRSAYADHACRFDVVSIDLDHNQRPRVTWIADAFE